MAQRIKTLRLHHSAGQRGSIWSATDVLAAQSQAAPQTGDQYLPLLPRCVLGPGRASSASREAESGSTAPFFTQTSATTLKSAFTALILSRWAARGAVLSPRSGSSHTVHSVDHAAGPHGRGVSSIDRRIFTRKGQTRALCEFPDQAPARYMVG